MYPELRFRRDRAAARHDAALERDAARAMARFTSELEGSGELAHVLGRPNWIVAQGDSEPYRFPSIRKV